jgi:peptidoglycan/LPS O-acetylase OafA/YrhL
MQFYLLAPLMLMLFVRLRHFSQFLFILLLACLLSVWLSLTSVAFRQNHTLLDYAYLFVLGSVLAWQYQRMRHVNIRLSYRTDVLFVAGFALLIASGYFEEWKVVPVWVSIARPFAHVAAIVCMCCGAFYGKATNAFLSMRYVTAIGIACYSIYLTHVPLIEIVNKFAVKRLVFGNEYLTIAADLVILTLAALAVGMAYHYVVERRFMSRNQLQAVAAATPLAKPVPPGYTIVR